MVEHRENINRVNVSFCLSRLYERENFQSSNTLYDAHCSL